MIPSKATAVAIANSLKEAFEAPKCDPQESAALTEAALVAIRKLANETRDAGEESEVGKWRRGLDVLIRDSKSRPEFLAKFVALTASLPGVSMEQLCLQAACDYALLAADADTPRRFRLDALREAGVATGALAVLIAPDGLEKRLRTDQARRAANVRHKDNRADRAHVAQWLQGRRHEFKSDTERVDAIMAGNEVSAKRSTIARWVTEWNREQRGKQKSPTV